MPYIVSQRIVRGNRFPLNLVDRDFRTNCTYGILLDTERIVSGFSTITGTVSIQARRETFIKSIWVELEGRSGTHRFLPQKHREYKNPRVFFIGNSTSTSPPPHSTQTALPCDYHTYPFELKLNYSLLPKSMTTEWGRLDYTVTLYVIGCISLLFEGEQWTKEAVAKVPIECNGFAVLRPSTLKPLLVTLKREKHFLSTLCKLELALERKGYIAGEEIRGTVRVDNPTGDYIPEIHVSLCQQIDHYYNLNSSKCTQTVLNEQKLQVGTNSSDILVELEIPVSEDLMPSFADRQKSIEIAYFIYVEMKREGKNSLEGKTEIVVGTTRGDRVAQLVNPAMVEDRRFSIESSDFDAISLQSYSTLPPSYSTVVSRRHSMESLATFDFDAISIQSCSTLPPLYSSVVPRRHSLETLPPSYDEVIYDHSPSAPLRPSGRTEVEIT